METCQAASLCLNFVGPPFRWINLWVWLMGVCWTGAYLLYLATAHLPGGIPLPALFLNLTWEFLFSFVWPQSGIQLFGIRVWFILDVLILVRYLQYSNYNVSCSAETLYMVLLAATMGAFGTVFVMEFHDYDGVYLAFGQNLLMSVAFVQQEAHRGGRQAVHQQLVYAGLLRWLGSFSASMALMGRVETTPLLLMLFISIFVWDVTHVVTLILLLQEKKKQAKHG